MKIPNGLKEIIRTFGNPNRADFGKKNLTMFKSAPLTYGRAKPKVIKIYVHKLLVPDLTAIFEEIASLERFHKKILIHTFDGCFCQRVQRGGTKASTHSWAIALDLNAMTNGLGHTPDQSQALVLCFTKRGWKWGGEWDRRRLRAVYSASEASRVYGDSLQDYSAVSSGCHVGSRCCVCDDHVGGGKHRATKHR